LEVNRVLTKTDFRNWNNVLVMLRRPVELVYLKLQLVFQTYLIEVARRVKDQAVRHPKISKKASEVPK
jgi:hypothetical protein